MCWHANAAPSGWVPPHPDPPLRGRRGAAAPSPETVPGLSGALTGSTPAAILLPAVTSPAPVVANLLDSTEVLTCATELLSRLSRDGYLFFRNLLDQDELASIATHVLRAVERDGWVDAADAQPWTLSQRAQAATHADLWPIVVQTLRLEALHRIAHAPVLEGLVRDVLGPDAFAHPMKIVRLVLPTSVQPMQTLVPHQELRVMYTQDMLVSWCPLVDCPLELGPLAILPGSHRMGLVPLGSGGEALASGGAWEGATWASAACRAGDVILFHCLTLHAVLPNRTDRFRVSMECRWQPASEPVYGAGLRPYGGGDWSSVCEGWSSTRWIEVPDGLAVMDTAPDLETWRPPPSRFKEESAV
jgi:Phytanoyl-CoA dioxygenase (PhyH)